MACCDAESEMALERETLTYERELPALLQYEGKYVLIHQDDVVDVFDSYEDALKAGYEKLGLVAFLVKRIQQVEQIQYFTRDVAPCRT